MAKQQPRGLGKGLGALLGGEDLTEIRKPVGYINKEVVSPEGKPQDTSDVLRIPVDLIEPNPYQPRMNFDTEALEELALSIRTLGLIQPITVRRKGDKYQIISGERRYRASLLAGMDMIPAYIRDASEQGMLEMAIVENIQRENLDPIEVALSYQRLMEECSLTQEQMAERVSKKRASVANQLRLLKLPAKVQHDLKVGLVSVGHAKVLLGIEDPAVHVNVNNAPLSDTARFFDPAYGYKNECDLTDGASSGRPDRVVFAPGETWVVDFKTGIDLESEYNEQVRHYCRAVSAMGYPKVSGWLLFLQPPVHIRQVSLEEDV